MGRNSRPDKPNAIALPDDNHEHIWRTSHVGACIDARCEGQSALMTGPRDRGPRKNGLTNILSIGHEDQKERVDLQRMQ